MKFEYNIVKRYLTSYKSSSLSTVAFIAIAGVFIGVASLVVVLAVMTGFEKKFRDSILATNSHIYILRYFSEGMEEYKDLADSIKTHDGIESVVPFVYSKGMIIHGEEVDGIAVRGLDATHPNSREIFGHEIIQGDFDLTSDSLGYAPAKIILGLQLAEKLQATQGDTVILAFPQESTNFAVGAYFKMKNFLVTGVFDSGLYDYNATLCYISIPAAQEFFGLKDEVMGLEIRVNDIYEAPQIGDKIRNSLGYPYHITDWTQMNKEIFDLMKLQKMVMFLIITLIVVVAAFNIISTLIMIVMEKEKEIGILKAIGATSKSVMKIFMIEGIAIGIVGTVAGIIAGVLLSGALKRYQFISISAEVYQLNTLPVELSVMDIIIIAGVTVFISFLATLYPAWQAAKLMPVDAIRYE